MNARTQLIVAVSGLQILLIGGTVLFHILEDWTWIQSFYFTVVTLTTVGYGDLAPSNDTTRLFVSFFILIGVTYTVGALGIISAGYLNRRSSKLEQKSKE